MTENIPSYIASGGGGTLQSPWFIKFMSVFMLLFCGFVDYIVLVQHSWKPTTFYPDVLVYGCLFIVWPSAALVWVSWALFSKVLYSSSGIEIFSALGKKRTLSWHAIKAVQFYRRFGVRRFILVDQQQKEFSIEMDSECFSDFLSFAEDHLPPAVEKEYRFTLDAARESIRSHAQR